MVLRAVGRRDEIDHVVALLERAQAGLGGQIVELTGEAGIGKSTVVRAVVGAARSSGWQVWRATPTVAESDLPWTGLAQLLDDVEASDFEELTQERAHQLRLATSAVRDETIAPEVVAFGLAALFDTAGADRSRPLLIAVDDVQWIDTPTAGALAYALRRTPGRSSVALLAQRTGEASPVEARRLVEPGSHTHVHLGGLSLASLREVLATTGRAPLGRAELARVHQRTGGNPMYAIELVRAVSISASLDDANLPASLRDTVGARVRALPRRTRQALGAAALTARPSLDLLTATLPDFDVLDVLEPAESSGVVELLRGPPPGGQPVVQFHHPLLATAAVDTLTGAERRMLHSALASTVDDTIERATHVLASGRPPDPEMAAELERAGADAMRGGALDTAVVLARACHDSTVTAEGVLTRYERCHSWADYANRAGRFTDAQEALGVLRTTLDEAAAVGADAPTLAEMRERLAVLEVPITSRVEGFAAAHDAIERALTHVVDPQRRLALHLALVRISIHLDVRRGIEVAERVLGPGADNSGDTTLGALLLAVARAYVGDPFDAERHLALVEGDAQHDESDRVTSLLVEPLVWTDHPRTEEIAERAISHGMAMGRRAIFLGDLMHLTGHLFVRGRWDRVDINMGLFGEYGEEFPDRHYANSTYALVLAARGDADAATATLERVGCEVLEDPSATLLMRMWWQKESALVAHTLGRVDAADQLLAAEEMYATQGIRSVRWPRFRRDLVEALVGAGRLDDASDAARRLAVDANHNAVATAFADADAAAAVVAAAHGDHSDARGRFEAAITVQRAHGLDYEVARTLLAAGTAARRAGRRRDSLGLLVEARALFDGMSATTWTRHCDHEIGRLGGTPSELPGVLTATERQIAEQVASGRSNLDVANALFVSVRTVESNLTRIYRKLGIRSRAGLARALADHPS